jgi:protein-L-isoaspartate(D-aspartate) O-methyltransferase
MVEKHLASRGIRDVRLLEAMASVPRERFVRPGMEELAYDDTPLPIGEGQTISQPYVVAVMIEALAIGPRDRVLEVGTGSGYAAAVLGRLAREVISVERIPSLAKAARQRLEEGGFDTVRVVEEQGVLGFPEGAPYDAILVSAGAPAVPDSLLQQLAPGGRLLIPVGTEPRSQELLLIRRTGGGYVGASLGSVRFVPLVGEQAWSEERDHHALRPPSI